MVADRANLGSLLANDNMAAVGALPDDIAVLREDTLVLDVVQQLAIALLMSLLDGSNALELLGNLDESLLTGLTSHAGIHICPFEVLTTSGSLEIGSGILDSATL